MNRGILALTILLGTVMIVVPTILVSVQQRAVLSSGEKSREQPVPLKIEHDLDVPVYLTREKRIEKFPLEAYVRGVVAAEMPADFDREALKAQALAARTYIIDRALKGDIRDVEQKYGEQAKGAWVTDTVEHQVFYTDEKLKAHWGADYEKNSNKINEAVNETRGQVITYDGRPIYAAFFSTSNGKTENSEDYWQKAYPYLRSVDSPWDLKAPSYAYGPVTYPLDDFVQKLEQHTGKAIAVQTTSGPERWIQIAGRTAGDKVAVLKVGDQTFSGREVREALNLRSSDFSLSIQGEKIAITTRGYGHGVGMSQWGANLMAKEGKTAKDIVKHYYRGVEIQDYRQWFDQKSNSKQEKTG